MVQRIRYLHEVLEQRQKDTFFLQLERQQNLKFCEDTRSKCLNWLAAQNCSTEMVAPLELVEGDSGLYYVDFESMADPKVLAWMQEFEAEDGSSLAPDLYKMIIIPWEIYCNEMQSTYKKFLEQEL